MDQTLDRGPVRLTDHPLIIDDLIKKHNIQYSPKEPPIVIEFWCFLLLKSGLTKVLNNSSAPYPISTKRM